MGVMDVMMDGMLKLLSKEQRERMMVNMMPLMMEGLDINELMPKMTTAMLKDVTVDDVIAYLKRTLTEKEKVAELLEKIQEANFMPKMMFTVYTSTLNFDETVTALEHAAPEHGWTIPDIRDLQQEYHRQGLSDMTKVKILYFCMAQGGYKILQDYGTPHCQDKNQQNLRCFFTRQYDLRCVYGISLRTHLTPRLAQRTPFRYSHFTHYNAE